VESISRFLDPMEPQGICLVGVGNLGRALLSYFVNRTPQFSIVAAFDCEPDKVNRVIHGCRCYAADDMKPVIAEHGITEAILAVPAQEAQRIADRLCEAGIQGIVNFAPVRLWVPDGVYVENVDVTMTLERVAFFSREGAKARA
jgi:redox-sensing transcriptional repressor